MDKSTEYYIEQISNSSYKLGQIIGLENSANMLLAQASSYFTMGHDNIATILRQLSKEFMEQAKKDREGYEKVDRKLEHDSWSILDNCITEVTYPEVYEIK